MCDSTLFFSASDVIPHDRTRIPIFLRELFHRSPELFRRSPELFRCSPELFRCSPELFHRSPGTRLLRLSVSIQVHLYPQLKREICIFWKSFIAKAGIWTKDLSHRSSALILLSYREMVEEGGFISQTVDSVCNFFDRKLPGRSNFSFLFFYLN